MVCTKEMMHTMSNEQRRPLRRSYSLPLKLEVVGQCQQPGASIAAIALAHGINANIVHRCACGHTDAPWCWSSPRPCQTSAQSSCAS